MISSANIQDLENLLTRYVYEDQWRQPWTDQEIPADLIRSYIAHAKKLSKLFTQEREHINSRYFHKKENRYAYIFYFHISSVMRTYHVIDQMFKQGIWPEGADTFMDLGCGSGGSLWALGLYCHEKGIPIKDIYGLDRDANVLRDAKKLWGRLADYMNEPFPDLTTYKQDLMHIQKLESDEFYNKVDIFSVPMFSMNFLKCRTRPS